MDIRASPSEPKTSPDGGSSSGFSRWGILAERLVVLTELSLASSSESFGFSASRTDAVFQDVPAVEMDLIMIATSTSSMEGNAPVDLSLLRLLIIVEM
eukprot:CAMPEP_0196760088 /NCGR_PEP_ID=MMETSP1091-20130531/105035_1 /TAXON_ID=302021 /ORGANISM="Rhodomonas sp., Strain CCMP768" /LENGTH=97 /DNA_ID=CAMNT_0042108953 /DNA_START=530 /DNA_END=824 /DNA_ORIENTATION=-